MMGKLYGWRSLKGTQVKCGIFLNVNGVIRDKPGPPDICGILCNNKRKMLLTFSNSIGLHNSNEAKVMTIVKAL